MEKEDLNRIRFIHNLLVFVLTIIGVVGIWGFAGYFMSLVAGTEKSFIVVGVNAIVFTGLMLGGILWMFWFPSKFGLRTIKTRKR